EVCISSRYIETRTVGAQPVLYTQTIGATLAEGEYPTEVGTSSHHRMQREISYHWALIEIDGDWYLKTLSLLVKECDVWNVMVADEHHIARRLGNRVTPQHLPGPHAISVFVEPETLPLSRESGRPT